MVYTDASIIVDVIGGQWPAGHRRRISMKLYMHPVSTAVRPVRLLIAENGIKCDEEIIDIPHRRPLSGAVRHA